MTMLYILQFEIFSFEQDNLLHSKSIYDIDLVCVSGSRFTETNNFGFVALDILHCLPEDSGTYTCRARNIIGEAITSANLNVQCKFSFNSITI